MCNGYVQISTLYLVVSFFAFGFFFVVPAIRQPFAVMIFLGEGDSDLPGDFGSAGFVGFVGECETDCRFAPVFV